MAGAKRAIFLIVDRGPAHIAKKTRAFVDSQHGRLRLFFLPPYSPDRNPDELVWKHLKADTVGRMTIYRQRRFLCQAGTCCTVRPLPLGCPVAIETFEGDTADPRTLAAQIDKVKKRFALDHVVLVGDRGMITQARIDGEIAPAGLDWITALRAPAIRELAKAGTLQMSLFDERDTLLEFCTLVNCLIIDEDGVYDPKLVNDRLLLGMKGTFSELELSILRQRSQEALRLKAARGDLHTTVAVGYVRSADDRLELDPDKRVREALHLAFRKFAEFGSVRQACAAGRSLCPSRW